MKSTISILSIFVCMIFLFSCEPKTKETTDPPVVENCTNDLAFFANVDWEDYSEVEPEKEQLIRWQKEPNPKGLEQRVFFQTINKEGCWKNINLNPYPNFQSGYDAAVRIGAQLRK